MRHLLSLLLLLVLASNAQAGIKTAAVMPLAKGAGGSAFDGLGRALADMMVTDLSDSGALQLVERMQLGLVLKELKLGRSGFLDKRTAQRLGRGLSAELVITGSFSVVKDTFVMDTRIIVVESGAVLVTARSSGPLDDFIAIEKEVVEKLLSALKVKLSAGQRRALLVQAPTESAKALASFGRGLEAAEKGQAQAAQKAFEEALKRDPDFAKASVALRDLAVATEQASVDERTRRRDAKTQALHAALAQLTPETQRSPGFVDTRASMLDFTIRQELLARAGQHCTRYKELRHYLLRRKGHFEGWFFGLKSTYQASWRAGEKQMDERGKQLGIVGPRTLYGTRPGALMFDASRDVVSGRALLLSSNMSPEKFDTTIVSALARCHPGKVQVTEFESLAKRAKRWDWIDKPLYRTVGIGPSTVTSRDSIDLYRAYLRALHRGFDNKVRTLTDAVLARHPKGDANRSQVLGRIQEVVRAGEQQERRRAARGKRTEAEILDQAKLVTTKSPSPTRSKRARASLRTGAICSEFRQAMQGELVRGLERFHKEASQRLSRREERLNGVASTLGPLVLAGCWQGDGKQARSGSQLLKLVNQGLKRPHPARLADTRCLEQVNSLKDQAAAAPSSPTQLYALARTLQGLRDQRCLVP